MKIWDSLIEKMKDVATEKQGDDKPREIVVIDGKQI